MIQLGSTALLAQRVVVFASNALLADHAAPSVVDATAGRFSARLPTGFTTALLLELNTDDDDFEEGATDDDGAIDEVVATLLELLTEDDEGAMLLELFDELLTLEIPALELLPVPATVNFIQFRLIA